MTVRIGTLGARLAAARGGASATPLQCHCPGAASGPGCGAVNVFPLLAPLFLVFEVWQLVMSERYLGIKQIARGGNPREMGPADDDRDRGRDAFRA